MDLDLGYTVKVFALDIIWWTSICYIYFLRALGNVMVVCNRQTYLSFC